MSQSIEIEIASERDMTVLYSKEIAFRRDITVSQRIEKDSEEMQLRYSRWR